MDKHTIMGFAALAGIAAFGLAGPAQAAADIFTQCQDTNNNNTPRAIGKLFTNAGGCSASVISGNNIIVTAAHCCYNRPTNNWIGGWSFARAYDSGNAPSGGPWLRDYRSSNHVDSVVHGYDSSSCTGTFGQTFNGPRFTSGNIATLCTAQGC